MKRTTSLIAFESIIKKLSKKRKLVYQVVSKFPNITQRECAFKMKVPVNTISGRFTELENLNVIKDTKKFKYFKGSPQPHTMYATAKIKK